MKEEELFRLFAHNAIRRGGEHYFDRASALGFVDLCKENDFAVLGLEGFWIAETTLPDYRWIADYSSRLHDQDWEEITTSTTADARQFIERAPLGLRFSIVVMSRSEFISRRAAPGSISPS